MSKSKKLLIVVHGIGNQVAGETVDQFIGAGLTNGEVNSEIRMLSEPCDETTRKIEVFPCHIRRFATSDSDFVCAEAYWADLSHAGTGAIATAIELFKGVLGLGHLVRESVAEFYSKKHWLNFFSRTFVMILHGPLLVLNIILLIGLLATIATLQLAPNAEKSDLETFAGYAIVAIGVITSAIGRRGTKHSAYLWRVFSNCMFWLGLALVLYALAVACPAFPWNATLRHHVEKYATSLECLVGLRWHGVVILHLLNIVWFVSLVTVSLMVIAETWKSALCFIRGRSCSPPLYAWICAFMMIMWMLIYIMFWSNVYKSTPEEAMGIRMWKVGAKPTLLLMLTIGLVGAASFCIWLRRKYWIQGHGTKDYNHKPIPRLLISTLVGWIASGLVVVMTIGLGLEIFESLTNEGANNEVANNEETTENDPIDNLTSITLLSFTALGSAYFLFLSDYVATGIGIGKDIITYFKGEPNNGEERSYSLRSRIHARFDAVVKSTVESESPSEILILTHSLGSIIAIEALSADLNSPLFATPGITTRKLVTMGSPYAHIFQYYFPRRFRFPSELVSKSPTWVNIFRIDDFVGTVIGKPQGDWPKNIPIDPYGHTDYWVDKQVQEELRNIITSS